ncbi:MAG: alpha,alpha-trehalase TreA [Bacteroidales bacterium]|nr:alpha,alpha-trehalase TreA [Bacteroidales bacterium]
MFYRFINILAIFVLMLCLHQTMIHAQINPADAFDSLFIEVQSGKVFTDQKKFPDCIPKFHPDTILKAYHRVKYCSSFSIKDFIAQNFDTTANDTASLLNHIHFLWSYLTRPPDGPAGYSSLIPLPRSYVVPGGRFREIYYWDSYFTMLGLAESGNYELIHNMINNFCYLVNKFGHIPNGNRTYYLSRSQPPFFSLMVELLAEYTDDSIYLNFMNCLEKEYSFWMNDQKMLKQDFDAKARVVKLENNELLNRYWDELSTPRPESYIQDVELYRHSGRDTSIYKDIRAAAESGWDFSSRWLNDDTTMKNIHTTEIIPVDLNCLLYHLEITLSRCYNLAGNKNKSTFYNEKAKKRGQLINKYFWNEKNGFYFDYNIKDKKQSSSYTLAAAFPLFFSLADNNQAEKSANVIREKFLKDGGVVTTLVNSGQQWDFPNGWAPLQWITYKGLKNYGYDDLADSIAKRWLSLNAKVYFNTGKMMEKYDVVNTGKPGGGGEYHLQDGFGWTNGVFLKFWNELHK